MTAGDVRSRMDSNELMTWACVLFPPAKKTEAVELSVDDEIAAWSQ